jgi:hypothetical protein
MPPEIQSSPVREKTSLSLLTTVTPLSKYLAMALFVIIPLVTLYVGLQFAPVEYVEVEKIVYRDTPKLNSEEYINPEALISPHPAGNISLRAETIENERGIPESELFVGDFSVLKASGKCNFEVHEEKDLFVSRPMLKSLISSETTIRESGMCYWAGGGSEFYLVQAGDSMQLVGLTISECGNLPECNPYGEPQVLYERDTAGIEKKLYTGGVFGG